MFEQLYIIGSVLYYIMFYHYSNFSIDLTLNLKIFTICILLSIILITVYYDIQIKKEKNNLRLENIQKNRMIIEKKDYHNKIHLHTMMINLKMILMWYIKNTTISKKYKRPSKLKLFDCYNILDDI